MWGSVLPRLVHDCHTCDIVIYNKKINIYLKFIMIPGTEILKPLDYPVPTVTKMSFVVLMR